MSAGAQAERVPLFGALGQGLWRYTVTRRARDDMRDTDSKSDRDMLADVLAEEVFGTRTSPAIPPAQRMKNSFLPARPLKLFRRCRPPAIVEHLSSPSAAPWAAFPARRRGGIRAALDERCASPPERTDRKTTRSKK